MAHYIISIFDEFMLNLSLTNSCSCLWSNLNGSKYDLEKKSSSICRLFTKTIICYFLGATKHNGVFTDLVLMQPTVKA